MIVNRDVELAVHSFSFKMLVGRPQLSKAMPSHFIGVLWLILIYYISFYVFNCHLLICLLLYQLCIIVVLKKP